MMTKKGMGWGAKAKMKRWKYAQDYDDDHIVMVIILPPLFVFLLAAVAVLFFFEKVVVIIFFTINVGVHRRFWLLFYFWGVKK